MLVPLSVFSFCFQFTFCMSGDHPVTPAGLSKPAAVTFCIVIILRYVNLQLSILFFSTFSFQFSTFGISQVSVCSILSLSICQFNFTFNLCFNLTFRFVLKLDGSISDSSLASEFGFQFFSTVCNQLELELKLELKIEPMVLFKIECNPWWTPGRGAHQTLLGRV